ncbi:predicted protein [Streptomyces viridochromogenes DSM 40736]|uniref:Predicted protein n=1 Tax=Streptomyces viridochromogenes (strain DSM 40736 / JCM 4977 / BCRC 1201 / Tue 494) TaxID=591159 RepID=D9X732_STRVT|nr:predicted protein [Streptomyces viridochromogenes DSM 40736]
MRSAAFNPRALQWSDGRCLGSRLEGAFLRGRPTPRASAHTPARRRAMRAPTSRPRQNVDHVHLTTSTRHAVSELWARRERSPEGPDTALVNRATSAPRQGRPHEQTSGTIPVWAQSGDSQPPQ